MTSVKWGKNAFLIVASILSRNSVICMNLENGTQARVLIQRDMSVI